MVQFLGSIIECDGTANVRAAPNTHSRMVTQLNAHSPQQKIIGQQGNWYRIQLPNEQNGFVHKSQIKTVENYIITSPDGFAYVRAPAYSDNSIGSNAIETTLPNGTRAQIIPEFSKGDWLFYTDQGLYHEKTQDGHDLHEGYIHKSQLRKAK